MIYVIGGDRFKRTFAHNTGSCRGCYFESQTPCPNICTIGTILVSVNPYCLEIDREIQINEPAVPF